MRLPTGVTGDLCEYFEPARVGGRRREKSTFFFERKAATTAFSESRGIYDKNCHGILTNKRSVNSVTNPLQDVKRLNRKSPASHGLAEHPRSVVNEFIPALFPAKAQRTEPRSDSFADYCSHKGEETGV